MAGRKVKLLSKREIELDGDLIPILDGLYQDVAVASGFDHDFLAMRKEMENLVAQLRPEELRDYFMSSLFLNFVSYENEMAGRILESLARTKVAKRALVSKGARTARPAKSRVRS